MQNVKGEWKMMKNYQKPELNVISFRTEEDIALKEYYYETAPGEATSYKVSLFSVSGADPNTVQTTDVNA